MKLRKYRAVLTGSLLFFNLIQGSNHDEGTSPVGAAEADFEVATGIEVCEFWRCPLNVKLDLQRDNLLKCLEQAREEKNQGEVISLENALKQIDGLREKYYLESYK